MRLRRVRLAGGDDAIAVWDDEATRWTAIPSAIAAVGDPAFAELPADDMIALLAGGEETREVLRALCVAARERNADAECELVPLLPVAPVLMRAFANSERHWIQGARGLVRLHLPRALPAIRAIEALTRRPFPPFRPGKLFYRQPAFYLGNALTFVPSGAEAPWPAYTKRLDFEIELGAIVVRPLRDATAAAGPRRDRRLRRRQRPQRAGHPVGRAAQRALWSGRQDEDLRKRDERRDRDRGRDPAPRSRPTRRG